MTTDVSLTCIDSRHLPIHCRTGILSRAKLLDSCPMQSWSVKEAQLRAASEDREWTRNPARNSRQRLVCASSVGVGQMLKCLSATTDRLSTVAHLRSAQINAGAKGGNNSFSSIRRSPIARTSASSGHDGWHKKKHHEFFVRRQQAALPGDVELSCEEHTASTSFSGSSNAPAQLSSLQRRLLHIQYRTLSHMLRAA